MNEREQFERNLELAREFFGDLLDEPVDRWPQDGAAVIFMPGEDPELAQANLEVAGSLLPDQPRVTPDISRVIAPAPHDQPGAPPSPRRIAS